MEDFAFKSFIESVSNEKFSHRVFRAIFGTKFQSDREEKQEYHLFMERINYNEAFAESWYKMLYGAQGSKRSVSEAAELPRRLCKEVSLPEETNADNSATEATSTVAAVPESSNSLGQAKMDADSSSETNTQHLSHCCEAKIDQDDLPKTEDLHISPKFDAFQVCTVESLNKSKPGIEAYLPTNVKTKGDILRAPIGSKDSGAKIQTLHNSTCIVHLPAETEKTRDLLKRLTPIGLNNSGQFAVYLALAKGFLVPEHCLILPIGHVQSERSLPSEALDEIKKYQKALLKCFEREGKCMVFYERSFKSPHMQIQCCPVPKVSATRLCEAFMDSAEDQDVRLEKIPENSEIDQLIQPGQPYFHLQLPNGDRYLSRVQKKFPLQFGRDVLASRSVLNVPGRSDWKNCKDTKEEEEKTAKKFREKFEAYDFTL
ncbi:hypothetical protein QYM36_001041 [Artemia franciscana]|uniref:CWF19-like protein 1 n=1 Tax=Artemia franciscana TaxID=6661 RepID=A0AA88I898_ARTSF|nr:hypothetical protein QYM36_001041 [Artemia franciscana]